MSEKKFIIEPTKKFEIRSVSYSDSALISSVEPIETGGIRAKKEDLETLVEAPLLEACEILHDKGIETVFSSANRKDIDAGYAYIVIDFESLSDENKKVALGLGELGKIHGSVPRSGIYIKIPIDNTSTVEKVRSEATIIAQSFEQQ